MDLTKVLSVVKSKKTGFFAAGVLFGTAGIKHYQVRMRKNFTPTAPQLFFVQKNV